jgi:hypothetical protein
MSDVPEPVWPDAPRYCPTRAFPPYRFVQGINAHPTEHRDGHRYGQPTAPVIPLDETWRENGDYLFGFDLYHQGYFWEAHEAWEGLWQLAHQRFVERELLQGLILNAAAQLKLHARNLRGAAIHSRRSTECMQAVLRAVDDGRVFGLNVESIVNEYKSHYEPLWSLSELPFSPPPRFEIVK